MESLVNPHVLQITPYKPGKPVEDIQREFGLAKVVKLASNENMLPIPENVRQAISDELSQVHCYPDSDNYYLRRRIAEYNGVGHGERHRRRRLGGDHPDAHPRIPQAGRKSPDLGKDLLSLQVATTEIAGAAAYVEAPMDRELRFDLEAIAARIGAAPRSSSSPTPTTRPGTILPAAAVRAFIDRVPDDRIIVLDNAYQEYVDDPDDYVTGLDEIRRKKNLIVLRTFSKVYGLAGLRVGYAMAHPEFIAILNRVKPPFNVTRIGQRAALASLDSDDYKDKSVRLNRANKARLFAQLQGLGLRVIPSQANFLLFFPEVDVAGLNLRLLRQGVIIRPMAGFGIPDAMRVTVGLEEENDFFIAKLEKALAEMKK